MFIQTQILTSSGLLLGTSLIGIKARGRWQTTKTQQAHSKHRATNYSWNNFSVKYASAVTTASYSAQHSSNTQQFISQAVSKQELKLTENLVTAKVCISRLKGIDYTS